MEKLLEIMRREGPGFISGEKLGAQRGVTRAAIWKIVEELRREGYKIEASTNKGYRLLEEPDRLPGDKLAALGIRYYDSLESTNRVARELAEEGCPGGTVILAEEQRQGRGRRGRSWSSPPGKGLWFSMVLRPKRLTPGEIAPVTLVVAVALTRTLREETGLPITVKWPNDLLIHGKKTAGILTEIKGEPDHTEYLVIGIGINVLQEEEDFPQDLRHPATSLYLESNRKINRASLLQQLLQDLTPSLELFFRQRFTPFRQPWIELSSTLGQSVNLTWPGGRLEGHALDLDPQGALIIVDKNGKHHPINYGELQAGDTTAANSSH